MLLRTCKFSGKSSNPTPTCLSTGAQKNLRISYDKQITLALPRLKTPEPGRATSDGWSHETFFLFIAVSRVQLRNRVDLQVRSRCTSKGARDCTHNETKKRYETWDYDLWFLWLLFKGVLHGLVVVFWGVLMDSRCVKQGFLTVGGGFVFFSRKGTSSSSNHRCNLQGFTGFPSLYSPVKVCTQKSKPYPFQKVRFIL